jgi:hypothetical protein
MVLVGGIQPNMLLGMILGAKFIPQPDKDADIEMNFLADATLCELPQPASLVKTTLVKYFDSEIVRLKNSALTPIPPFFWDNSGRASIHGSFTTALKLFGEIFFMDMMDKPDDVIKKVDWISEAYTVLCQHFAATINLKIDALHVGECSGCMIGPELHRDFVIKPADYLGSQVAPVRLHSCGDGNHLIDSFKTATNISTLDLGGANRLDLFRQAFGKEYPLEIALLMNDLTAPTSTDILQWLDDKLSENDGGPLEIKYHLEADYNIDNIYAVSNGIKNYLSSCN